MSVRILSDGKGSTSESRKPTFVARTLPWFHDNIEDPNDRGFDANRRGLLNAIVEFSGLVR